MKLFRLFFFPLLALFILASCGGSSGGGGGGGGGGEQREEEPTGGTTGGTSGGGGGSKFDVVLDSELTGGERVSTNNSIDLLERLTIDGSRISGFSQIFGGNRTSNVVNYLEARVNYIVSQNTSHSSRLIYPSGSAFNNLEFFASNQSVTFWYFDQYYAQEGGVRYLINDRPRNINSSRIGIVQLGDIFTRADAITQAITLVHEARHSDCPEGALLSDILNVAESGGNIGLAQNKKCGQLHSSCSGLSCDSFPWGPYAIDYIYSLAIFETCSNCSETQKLQALSNANQVQNAAFDINGTMNGVYGRPNMSNSTRVRNDL